MCQASTPSRPRFDLAAFQVEQGEWSRKNFGEKFGTGYRSLLGVMEEVGELAHAHLKEEQGIRINEDHHEAKKDAVGDIVIFLADYCNGQGLSLAQCVEDTWTQVRARDWAKNPKDGSTVDA